MANELDKFGSVMNKGVDNFNPDLHAELEFDNETYNVSNGMGFGSGPRPGISPLPNHNHTEETPDPTTDDTPVFQGGLMKKESYTDIATSLSFPRVKALGMTSLGLGKWGDLPTKGNVFFVPCLNRITPDAGATYYYFLNFLFSAKKLLVVDGALGTKDTYDFDLSSGISSPLYTGELSGENLGYPETRHLSFDSIDFIKSALVYSDDEGEALNHASVATLAVSGKSIQMKWFVGRAIDQPVINQTYSANFWEIPWLSSIGDPIVSSVHAGQPPFINLRNYKRGTRDLTFYVLGFYNDLSGRMRLNQKYVYYNTTVDDSIYVSTFDYYPSAVAGVTPTSNYDVQALVDNSASRAAFAPTLASTTLPTGVLVNDEEGVCDSSYKAILYAAKKAIIGFVQEWERGIFGHIVQYVDPTNMVFKPRVKRTIEIDGTSYYEENALEVSTCFSRWPSWDGTTALPDASALPGANTGVKRYVGLGAAGSGILRSTTDYEFTFSIFDKQIGHESNVGKPVKFRTGTNDFVALSLYIDEQSGGNWLQNVMGGHFLNATTGQTPIIDIDYFQSYFGSSTSYYSRSFNYLEIRFYYRELGTQEWLPALFIDAAKWFYYPDHQTLWACQGDVAALPGGQPGGFNDYSELPKDDYSCVLTFKGRAFWFSEKNMVFSLRNSVFAYPLRNSAPAPSGRFKGAIVHTYRGESEQQSRLVVFGDKETYIGRFTGNMLRTPVIVSPETIAEFDLDGSDFVLENWTSNTAFSYRSAVVADGDLYFLGPQGVYLDDGVGRPRKISESLEPDVFRLYDQSKTDEIHCTYDEESKEIIWFYPPSGDSDITHALTYNTRSGRFNFHRYDCKIDWATKISTNNTDVDAATTGYRTAIGAREDATENTQRVYFHDLKNKSGDFKPGNELMVKSFTTPTDGQRRLTLAAGYDAAAFAQLAVGDYLCFQQLADYASSLTDAEDFIGKITAIGAGTIDVRIPSTVSLDASATLTFNTYFPVWHKAADGNGLHAFSWQIKTNYWMPGGVNYFGRWLWFYLLFKYQSLKKINSTTFNLAYRTPSGGDFITDAVTFSENSDGNFQLFHATRTGNENNQGQAIKLKLSGAHIGEEWVLQYLEAHALSEQSNFLKRYQG